MNNQIKGREAKYIDQTKWMIFNKFEDWKISKGYTLILPKKDISHLTCWQFHIFIMEPFKAGDNDWNPWKKFNFYSLIFLKFLIA